MDSRRRLLSSALIATTFVLGMGKSGEARELGIPPSLPPGHSLGFPVGTPLPPGVYATLGSDYITGDVIDDDGNEIDQSVEDLVFFARVGWVPGFELFGGQYSFGFEVPYINREIDRGPGFPNPFQAGTVNDRSAFGRITVQPIRLSWDLGGGRFVSSGLGVKIPHADFDVTDSVQISGDFWTIIPDIAFTWMTPSWETTLHANYMYNTENSTTDYKSGSELSVNFTALRKLENNWAVGPLAYYQAQISGDENNGTSYNVPFTNIPQEFDKYKNYGVGIGVRKQIGPMLINFNVTQSLYARNEVENTLFGLRLTLPLGGPPPGGPPPN
ncbi:MAG: transporter [Pseudomonadota bacterium]